MRVNDDICRIIFYGRTSPEYQSGQVSVVPFRSVIV
jgi:hypothetical protein